MDSSVDVRRDAQSKLGEGNMRGEGHMCGEGHKYVSVVHLLWRGKM